MRAWTRVRCMHRTSGDHACAGRRPVGACTPSEQTAQWRSPVVAGGRDSSASEVTCSAPRAARLEHLGRLVERARVELDQQVHGDAAVVLVLVEAHVREELAHAVVAERRVGERVAGLGPGAALDVVGVDRDRARRDPRACP